MTDLVSQLVGALNRLYVAAPTGLECNSFHHSKGEFHSHSEPCKPAAEYVEALAQARSALTAAKAGGWVAVQNKPAAYRVDWPVEAGVGMRRFYGADEWESSRGTVEFFGGVPVPLAPLPTPPKEQA